MSTHCNECGASNTVHKKDCFWYPDEAKLRDIEIVELQAELVTAQEEKHSGCVHTIATAVDTEGCCTSCGEDLNYLALMQMKLDSTNHDYTELLKERADYVAENARLRQALKGERP